ncbi:hypothetical protein R1flu_013010 [Riccia fluitans]|uniref:Uncharacterized protein n=1 Tax=Riccia fluitans TaxID=41844 RepID=A0ABD1ZDI5_9MARC
MGNCPAVRMLVMRDKAATVELESVTWPEPPQREASRIGKRGGMLANRAKKGNIDKRCERLMGRTLTRPTQSNRCQAIKDQSMTAWQAGHTSKRLDA